MSPDQERFMRLERFPARLTVEQTAWVLGFQSHDIPVLVRNRLLHPLGHPPQCGTKFFAAGDVEELSKDTRWLARASDAIHQHWRRKNSRPNDEAESAAA